MTVLRGGLVVDGTGAPAARADVVLQGDMIVEVVEAGSAEAIGEVVEMDGLTVCPGFIDCHTHYDAQVLWDPDLTPSSWHGITTVVMGNCGFGIAPTAVSARETIALTLENVEGMSFEALSAGIPWDFETFPEYLAAVRTVRPRLNVAAMIGHTPLRLYVMGEDALEREASPEELEEMCRVVGDAIDAGAIGLSSSRQPAHAGAYGKPVPSRLASVSELQALAGVLGDKRAGIVQITRGPDFDLDELADLSLRTGRPVTWTALLATRGGLDVEAAMERTEALGGDVWPQIACRPVVFQVQLREPAPFARIGPFAEVLSVPAGRRRDYYLDPLWRSRARTAAMTAWPGLWNRVYVAETEASPALVGPSMAELATRRGQDALDVMCDIALADDLETRFRVVIANDDEAAIGRLLGDRRNVLGLSDAGAHASQLCDAVFATYLLQHWVRETAVLPIEEAVRRLTSQPADLFGLARRGRIAPGNHADIVSFDHETVGPGPERRVYDLPAGADRLVASSEGIHGVWVNGARIVAEGQPTHERPGQVLRPDTQSGGRRGNNRSAQGAS